MVIWRARNSDDGKKIIDEESGGLDSISSKTEENGGKNV
jgi:hypothetical protein